jgi:hypothetical protein
MKGEIRKLPKECEPRLFKCRIIIGIDIIDADEDGRAVDATGLSRCPMLTVTAPCIATTTTRHANR